MRLLASAAAVFALLALAATTASAAAAPSLFGNPYTRRFNMTGCGIVKSTSLPAGQRVLFANEGTANVRAYSMQAPMPQWALKTGMWFTVTVNGPSTVFVTVRRVGCVKPSVYTVKFTR